MSTKIEQSTSQLANAANVRKVWGDIIINVKESPFFAKGSGDDTTAFQMAVDYANSIGKKDIHVPAGTYNYTMLENVENITFYGDGVTLVGSTVLDLVSFHELSDRINNIVAGAGDSNIEIVDARKSSSGVTYPVLKSRLDTERSQSLISITTLGDRITAEQTERVAGDEALNNRVDNLIIGSGDGNPEVVDARMSAPKLTTFPTLKARLDAGEQDLVTHVADTSTAHGINTRATKTEFNAHVTAATDHTGVFARYAIVDLSLRNIYVNGAIGNDANDGSANDAGHALKTIQAAINKRSYIQVGPFNIWVAAGTYNENLSVKGQIGDNFVIRGAATKANAGLYKINSIWFDLCRYSTIIGFDIVGNSLPAFQGVIRASNVSYMEVQECTMTTDLLAAQNDGVKLTHGSIVYIKNSDISKKNSGVGVASGSQAIVNNCGGTENLYGLFAQEGHIYKNGTVPTGAAPEFTAFGGVIS